MKNALKKRAIKVEKLIFKRKKRGFIGQKIVFLKDLFKKTSTIPSVVKDQNNFWALNMKITND